MSLEDQQLDGSVAKLVCIACARDQAPPASRQVAPMAVSGTVFGAMLGLGVQFYSNAVRKLPLMRNPWEHAIALGVGGVAGMAP